MNAALFVDLNNIFYCSGKKFAGKKVDYKKYLEAANALVPVTRAFAYGFQMEDEALAFITCLKKIGYDIKYKKPRMIGDGDGKEFKRMDWNVGMCCDIFRIMHKVDAVIIGSSDPELAPMLTFLYDKGIQTIIYSALISRELKEVSNRYFEIDKDCLESKEEVEV